MESHQPLSPISSPYLARAKEFFASETWSCTQHPEEPLLWTSVEGENGSWSCLLQAIDDAGIIAFYSICPMNAPAEIRLSLAEFLTRANWGLSIGNFELDMSDGEVRFKTSASIAIDELSLRTIGRLVYGNVVIMDSYLPGIMNILYGKATPVEALALVEG